MRTGAIIQYHSSLVVVRPRTTRHATLAVLRSTRHFIHAPVQSVTVSQLCEQHYLCVERDNSPTLSRTSSSCRRTSPAYPAHDASRCQTPHQPRQLQQNMFLSWVQDPFLLRSQERLAAGPLACIVSTMERSLFVIGRLPSHRTIHASVQRRIGIRMLQAKNLGDRSRNEGARPWGAVQQERAPKKLVLQPLNIE